MNSIFNLLLLSPPDVEIERNSSFHSRYILYSRAHRALIRQPLPLCYNPTIIPIASPRAYGLLKLKENKVNYQVLFYFRLVYGADL